MTLDPGSAGVSVRVTLDLSGAAAQLQEGLSAIVAELSTEVFTPLSEAAVSAGAQAGEAIAAGVASAPIIADFAAIDAEAAAAGAAAGETIAAAVAESVSGVPVEVDIEPKIGKLPGGAEGSAQGKEIAVGLAEGIAAASPLLAAEGHRGGAIYSRAFIGPVKAVGETAIAFFAFEKVKEFAQESFSITREQQKIQAGIGQVIKTTGNAANVSTASLEELAKHLEETTGATTVQTEASERLLLTFTNVKNEVGDGNDVFDRAITTANDLSAALGINTTSAVRAVGRALNDPVQGLALLTRYGVQFTKQTKEQIATLEAEGKGLQAQKIVLDQLNERFGGSAHAAETMGDRMHVAIEKVQLGLGHLLRPAVDNLENAFIHLVGAGSAVIGFFQHNDAAAAALAATIGVLLTGAVVKAGAEMAVVFGPRITALIGGTVLRLSALVGTAQAAGGGLAGIGAAGRSLVAGIGPATIATVGIGAAVGLLTYHWHKEKQAQDEARKATEDWVASLHTNENELSSIASSMDIVRQKGEALKAQILANPDQIFDSKVTGQMDGITEAYQHLQDQQVNVHANEVKLAAQFGLTADQASQAATATQTDLGGSYVVLAKNVGDYIAKQQESHHPTTQAAKDFADLGSKANTAADDVNLLDDAWKNLVGDFLGHKEAQLQVKEGMIALNAALKKSNDEVSLRNKNSRASFEALKTEAENVHTLIDSYKQTPKGYANASAAANKWLQNLKDSGAAGPIVKKLTDDIQSYLDQLAEKAGPAGQKTGAGYAGGIRNQTGNAKGAARGLASGAKDALTGYSAFGLGETFSQSYIDGISAKIRGAIDAAGRLALAAITGVKTTNHNGPPSLVGLELGNTFGRSYGDGIAAMNDHVHRASKRLADAAIQPHRGMAVPSASAVMGGDGASYPTSGPDAWARGGTYAPISIVTPSDDPVVIAEQVANRMSAGTVGR